MALHPAALHPAALTVPEPGGAARPALDRPALDEGWLWAVASGLASVATPWELEADARADVPGAERVLATPLYEAWLQSWPAGTASDDHVHAGVAAFCVVAGTLEEWGPGERGEAVLLGRHRGGQGRVVPAGRRHRLRNAGHELATAVHVSAVRAA
jgi:hypothetical protein